MTFFINIHIQTITTQKIKIMLGEQLKSCTRRLSRKESACNVEDT